jgi:hypothetical protein
VLLCNGLFNEDVIPQNGRIMCTEFGMENFYMPKGIFRKFIFNIKIFKHKANFRAKVEQRTSLLQNMHGGHHMASSV